MMDQHWRQRAKQWYLNACIQPAGQPEPRAREVGVLVPPHWHAKESVAYHGRSLSPTLLAIPQTPDAPSSFSPVADVKMYE